MKKILLTIIAFIFIFTISSRSIAKPITFAVLSDIHYAVDGKDKNMKMLASGKEMLPGLLDKIAADPAIEFVVLTGDILVDPYAADLKELSALLSSHLKKPYFVVPGNHERIDRTSDDKQEGTFPFADFVKTFQGHGFSSFKSFWSADFAGYHLVGLDTTLEDTWGGKVPDEELKWLKRDLAANGDKFTIVFAHHPIVEFHHNLKLEPEYHIENIKEVEKLLFKYRQVKFVVTGHTHFAAAEYNGGIHYLSAPSLIVYPFRYTLITADTDHVSYRTIPVDQAEELKQKAIPGMLKYKWWRDKFRNDAEMIDLFRGIDGYSFEPRGK